MLVLAPFLWIWICLWCPSHGQQEVRSLELPQNVLNLIDECQVGSDCQKPERSSVEFHGATVVYTQLVTTSVTGGSSLNMKLPISELTESLKNIIDTSSTSSSSISITTKVPLELSSPTTSLSGSSSSTYNSILSSTSLTQAYVSSSTSSKSKPWHMILPSMILSTSTSSGIFYQSSSLSKTNYPITGISVSSSSILTEVVPSPSPSKTVRPDVTASEMFMSVPQSLVSSGISPTPTLSSTTIPSTSISGKKKFDQVKNGNAENFVSSDPNQLRAEVDGFSGSLRLRRRKRPAIIDRNDGNANVEDEGDEDIEEKETKTSKVKDEGDETLKENSEATSGTECVNYVTVQNEKNEELSRQILRVITENNQHLLEEINILKRNMDFLQRNLIKAMKSQSEAVLHPSFQPPVHVSSGPFQGSGTQSLTYTTDVSNTRSVSSSNSKIQDNRSGKPLLRSPNLRKDRRKTILRPLNLRDRIIRKKQVTALHPSGEDSPSETSFPSPRDTTNNPGHNSTTSPVTATQRGHTNSHGKPSTTFSSPSRPNQKHSSFSYTNPNHMRIGRPSQRIREITARPAHNQNQATDVDLNDKLGHSASEVEEQDVSMDKTESESPVLKKDTSSIPSNRRTTASPRKIRRKRPPLLRRRPIKRFGDFKDRVKSVVEEQSSESGVALNKDSVSAEGNENISEKVKNENAPPQNEGQVNRTSNSKTPKTDTQSLVLPRTRVKGPRRRVRPRVRVKPQNPSKIDREFQDTMKTVDTESQNSVKSIEIMKPENTTHSKVPSLPRHSQLPRNSSKIQTKRIEQFRSSTKFNKLSSRFRPTMTKMEEPTEDSPVPEHLTSRTNELENENIIPKEKKVNVKVSVPGTRTRIRPASRRGSKIRVPLRRRNRTKPTRNPVEEPEIPLHTYNNSTRQQS